MNPYWISVYLLKWVTTIWNMQSMRCGTIWERKMEQMVLGYNQHHIHIMAVMKVCEKLVPIEWKTLIFPLNILHILFLEIWNKIYKIIQTNSIFFCLYWSINSTIKVTKISELNKLRLICTVIPTGNISRHKQYYFSINNKQN